MYVIILEMLFNIFYNLFLLILLWCATEYGYIVLSVFCVNECPKIYGLCQIRSKCVHLRFQGNKIETIGKEYNLQYEFSLYFLCTTRE